MVCVFISTPSASPWSALLRVVVLLHASDDDIRNRVLAVDVCHSFYERVDDTLPRFPHGSPMLVSHTQAAVVAQQCGRRLLVAISYRDAEVNVALVQHLTQLTM